MGPRRKFLGSASLVGADLAVLKATLQAMDKVTASFGHCAILEAATAADLRRGVLGGEAFGKKFSFFCESMP